MTAHEAFWNWVSPYLLVGGVVCVIGVAAVLVAAIAAFSTASYRRQ